MSSSSATPTPTSGASAKTFSDLSTQSAVPFIGLFFSCHPSPKAEDLLLLLLLQFAVALAVALLSRLFLQSPYNKPANPKVVISTRTTDSRTVLRVVKRSSIA
jgi:hypothetical protein